MTCLSFEPNGFHSHVVHQSRLSIPKNNITYDLSTWDAEMGTADTVDMTETLHPKLMSYDLSKNNYAYQFSIKLRYSKQNHAKPCEQRFPRCSENLRR